MKVYIVIKTENGKLSFDFARAFDSLEKAQNKINKIAESQRANLPDYLRCIVAQTENSVTITNDNTQWKIEEIKVE
jgi:hypothetical protein